MFADIISGSVYFSTGSAKVESRLAPYLDELATHLLKKTGSRVRVEGHTDDTGTDADNQQLSVARAESIRAELLSRGVPPDRILTDGFGKTRPLVPNTSAANRGKNRRVEISVLADSKPLPAYVLQAEAR